MADPTRAQLLALLDAAGDGLGLLDEAGRLSWGNAALGLPPGSAPDDDLRRLSLPGGAEGVIRPADAARWAELALTDALTELPNRRAFLQIYARQSAAMKRHGRRGAVAIADIDHFKRVNDSHGHAAGDAVLMQAAARLNNAVRDEDYAARWGGEEFILLLAEIEAGLAVHVLERVRRLFSAEPFDLPDGGQLALTCSFGVADIDPEAPMAALDAADQALYRAKREGRDRVAVA